MPSNQEQPPGNQGPESENRSDNSKMGCRKPLDPSNSGANAIGSKRRIEALQRKAEALRLRRQGKTYAQIAEALGLADPSGAHSLIQRELKSIAETCKQDAQELRDEALDKLDYIWRLAMKRAKDGDPKALMVMVAVDKRKAALLGIDKPQQVTVTQMYAIAEVSPQCPSWPGNEESKPPAGEAKPMEETPQTQVAPPPGEPEPPTSPAPLDTWDKDPDPPKD